MNPERLSEEEALALVRTTLERCGTDAGNAAAVARALIDAELAGQSGHGLRRVESYAAQVLSGKVVGNAVPQARAERPGALVVDAGNGFAYPAIDVALEWLAKATPEQGIAIAGIRRSHHCGVAGVIAERLAEKGLIALVLANTPAAMAPWGGKQALFGTNPLAFAAPVENGEPVVVDISLSKVARGKIMAARQQGKDIPEGWALDSEGVPTTDPSAALGGTMVPMGDAKGTALALMVEMLSAGLTGANYAYEASSFFDGDGPPPGTGQAIIAVDPAAFGPGATTRFAVLADAIESMDGARIPGRRRQDHRRRLLKEGIPAERELLERIHALGR